jgi:hypothetical protein
MENSPEAVHGFDHFHVVKLMIEKLDDIKSNEWINKHFREPTMPFKALKPTELILKVSLPLTNINF